MRIGKRTAWLMGVLISVCGVGKPLLPLGPFPSESELAPVTVAVAEVILQVTPELVPFHGVTRGSNRTTLAFEVRGQMLTRSVRVGDRVAKGQVVATLDPEVYRLASAEAKAQLVALEAQLAQAERNETRVKALLGEGAATQEELEQLTAARESLQARQQALKTSIANLGRREKDTRLKAPFAGTVTRVFREPGEFLAPGSPVISLSSAVQVEVEIEVPETFLPGLSVGDRLKATFPFGSHEVGAVEITSFSQHGQEAGALFPVILSFKNGLTLLPGQSVTVWFPKHSANAVQVPLSAVFNPGGEQARVFTARNGVAQRLDVDVLAIQGAKALVRGSFLDDDKVIYRGHHRLLDGDAIRVGEQTP